MHLQEGQDLEEHLCHQRLHDRVLQQVHAKSGYCRADSTGKQEVLGLAGRHPGGEGQEETGNYQEVRSERTHLEGAIDGKRRQIA